MKNYYNILGISYKAPVQEVHEAYKKLALKFHPDRNPEDLFFANWFKEINEAKQVLINEELRAEYDFKLSSYEDAYELLKQQQAQQLYEGNLRRQSNRKRGSGSRKWWMTGSIAAIIAVTFLFIERLDSKGFESESRTESWLVENETSDVPSVTSTTSKSQMLHPTTSKSVENKLAITEAEKKEMKVTQPDETQIRGSKQSKAKRPLTNSEKQQIFRLLQAQESIKCVQVIHTTLSSIEKDFAIVPILQEKGYIIAGREVTSTEVNGFIVEKKGNCLRLIIGKN